MRQAGSKAESWSPLKTSSVWQALLVLTFVIFLNFIVTQSYLGSQDKIKRHDFYFSSVISARNISANVHLDTIVPIKGGNIEGGKTAIVKTAERKRKSEQEYERNGARNSADEKYRGHHLGFEPNRIKNTNKKNSIEEDNEIDSGNGGDENQQSNNLGYNKIRVKNTREQQSKPENDGLGEGNSGKENHEDNTGNEVQYIPRHRATERQQKKRRERQKNKSIEKEKENNSNYTLSPEDVIKYSSAPLPNVSNTIYYKDIPPEFLVEDPSEFLWDRPDAMIPEWMKDYFRWHRWKRSTWEDRNITADGDWWKSERWIISQCLMDQDRKKCGGTADRLKPILPLLRIAYENKRMYLIRWTRPAPLEEFLLPPAGGFDWRVPPFLAEVLEDEKNGKKFRTRIPMVNYADGGLALMRARYQVRLSEVTICDAEFTQAFLRLSYYCSFF